MTIERKLLVVLLVIAIVFALVFGGFWLFEKIKDLRAAPAEPTEAPMAAVLPPVAAPTEEPQASEPVPAATEAAEGVPGESTALESFRAVDALDYPMILPPDASRQVIFPDVPDGDQPALVAYESPFEDGDYCDNIPCDMDVSQYYYRVMTAGEVTIPGLGVHCIATPTKGCLVVVINHFGPTAMYRHNRIDHGFTIAGRVWNMENPEDATVAGQALLDHYVYRMTAVPGGANCSTIDACETVEWHLVVIGNGEAQVHWTGLFRR